MAGNINRVWIFRPEFKGESGFFCWNFEKKSNYIQKDGKIVLGVMVKHKKSPKNGEKLYVGESDFSPEMDEGVLKFPAGGERER